MPIKSKMFRSISNITAFSKENIFSTGIMFGAGIVSFGLLALVKGSNYQKNQKCLLVK